MQHVFRDTRRHQMELYTSQQCYLSLHLVTCTQNTQSTVGVSCDRMAMENIPDEYCDMFLTLGTCTMRAGTAEWEYRERYPNRRHPDCNLFRRLEQRFCDSGSVTRISHVNSVHSLSVRTPVNDDTLIPWYLDCKYGTRVMEKLTRCGTRIPTISSEGPRSISSLSSEEHASVSRRSSTTSSTHYGCAHCTLNSVDSVLLMSVSSRSATVVCRNEMALILPPKVSYHVRFSVSV
jgi:hypothetical protein